MSQEPETTIDDKMRPEYDSSGGVRGKYYEAYKQATNIIVIELDVIKSYSKNVDRVEE